MSDERLQTSLAGRLYWDVTGTRLAQSCILPGSLNRVPATAGVKAGKSSLPGGYGIWFPIAVWWYSLWTAIFTWFTYSSTPTIQSYCGLVWHRSCFSCHLRTVRSTSTRASSSQWMSSETWACGSTLSCQCARMLLGWYIYHLRCIPDVRRQLGQDVTVRLVTALVLSRLDYCNTMLPYWHRSSKSCGNLVVSQTCRRIGDRTFSVAAPRAWNKIQTELKLLCSMGSFRRGLKTFLFDSVYGHQDTDWLCDAPSVF